VAALHAGCRLTKLLLRLLRQPAGC